MICYHCTRGARPGFRTCAVHARNAVPGGYGTCGTRIYPVTAPVVVVERDYGPSFGDVVAAEIVADILEDAVETALDFGGDY